MASFRATPETFRVEEIPAYPPSGVGDHMFLWVEKHDLTTPEMCKRLARALHIAERDIGYAGLKDRHATTLQWLSVPAAAAERLATTDSEIEGLIVHRQVRHNHKLRTGHNHGNRFTIVLQDVNEHDRSALSARLHALATEGLPNRFGLQRFGRDGDNAEQARGLVVGTTRVSDPRKRRLLLSALQSAVFNRVLDTRLRDGTVRTVLGGDVLRKTDTGGLFYSSDPATDQARLDAGAVQTTGPMPGNRVLEPPPDSPAAALESAAALVEGLSREALRRFDRDLPGVRRPLLVPVLDASVYPDPADPPDVMRIGFALPSGSYATVLVEALGVPLC